MGVVFQIESNRVILISAICRLKMWLFFIVVSLYALYSSYTSVECVPDKCSTDWQEKYTVYHAEMLKSQKPRIIVAVPHASGE